MTRIGLTALGLLTLGACESFQAQGDALANRAEAAVWQGTNAVGRAYADTFQDTPFDSGAVSVLTQKNGELRTFKLAPCQGGTHVCGATSGHLQRTDDYYVVSGAYPGRRFYLSPGGDGYVQTNGAFTPLAWN